MVWFGLTHNYSISGCCKKMGKLTYFFYFRYYFYKWFTGLVSQLF